MHRPVRPAAARPAGKDHIFLGIDPGQSGGIAAIGTLGPAIARPMAATERDVWQIIEGYGPAGMAPAFAIIEAVHSFPGQGVASSFKFGMGYGGLRMALVAAGIPFEAVSPQKWQKVMGIPPKKGETKTQHKNRLKARAQELFPSLKITLATSDALLLAAYAQRIHADRTR